jgi:hypothetical protein
MTANSPPPTSLASRAVRSWRGASPRSCTDEVVSFFPTGGLAACRLLPPGTGAYIGLTDRKTDAITGEH